MKKLMVVVVLGLAATAYAKGGKAKEAVLTKADDMKWVEIPESGGAQISPVTGDPMKGAYSAFVKLPAGQDHPLHTHTNDVKAVIISGTFVVTPEGGTESKLGPGSYFMVPGGMRHTSRCDAGAPCVFFQEGTAKFDVKPVAAAPAPKGK